VQSVIQFIVCYLKIYKYIWTNESFSSTVEISCMTTLTRVPLICHSCVKTYFSILGGRTKYTRTVLASIVSRSVGDTVYRARTTRVWNIFAFHLLNIISTYLILIRYLIFLFLLYYGRDRYWSRLTLLCLIWHYSYQIYGDKIKFFYKISFRDFLRLLDEYNKRSSSNLSSEIDSKLKCIKLFAVVLFMIGWTVTQNCVVICAHVGHASFSCAALPYAMLRPLRSNVRPTKEFSKK
jgi:hypothetical protein